ncbi:hypothetical protein RCO27_18620 [Sphingosinicella sp. LHD-64]|uniref:hypothetical protein n=1 Tax=Sphingosinicella sp. LHD-64 TaxID=3072139 RepID=UPI00280ECB59|nr:hypothetical protein [Sphingosinicella sp. LHD-64]MDQ8758247.1 hypothetical protein [Sphingosinicella sp. LHD-64]
MIARGFRPVAWVAAVGTAALSCYMLSLQVASERAELASIERRIIATRQDIRQLQTELGTRGRLQQLEAWNADVLALAAPISGQYLEAGVSLARFDTRQPSLDDRAAEVRLASAETPAAPGAVTVAPRQATMVARAAAPAALEPARPMVQRASLTLPPRNELQRQAAAPARATPRPVRTASATLPRDPAPTARRESTQPTRAATSARARPAPVRTAINLLPEELTERAPAAPAGRPAATPPRSRGLLADDTLRDLGRTARAERGGARN